MDDASPDPSAQSTFELSILHHGKTHAYAFEEDATLEDLARSIQRALAIPLEHQKFLISPKIGMLKPPYPDPSLRLAILRSKKIQLLAPLPSDLRSLAAPAPRPRSIIRAAKPTRTIDHKRAHDSVTYTFGKILPLPYLPNPARSQTFLERLRDDPGIRAAMARHRFAVGVLTEMDPAMHTTHESRTLGLNRNRGQVIELRLRTDAYDGYRDYRTIRRTLCHELAHNVFGEHDRNFWDLTKEIEREVEKADWTRGGRSVGEEEFYNPQDGGMEGDHVDGGGWTGGEFVLGGSQVQGESPREAAAKAAEERIRRLRDVGEKPPDAGAS